MELDPSWLLLLFVAYALSDPVEFHYQAVDWVCLFFFVGISVLGGEDERRICACCGRSRVRESGGGHAEDNELENQVERRLVYYHDLAVSDPVDRPVFFFDFAGRPPLESFDTASEHSCESGFDCYEAASESSEVEETLAGLAGSSCRNDSALEARGSELGRDVSHSSLAIPGLGRDEIVTPPAVRTEIDRELAYEVTEEEIAKELISGLRDESTFLSGLTRDVVNNVVWPKLVSDSEKVDQLAALSANMQLVCRSLRQWIEEQRVWDSYRELVEAEGNREFGAFSLEELYEDGYPQCDSEAFFWCC
ncbi:hypothetical protein M758_6G068100 [Ceratodon purpureus]|nr:hypothetical protein M758_6G068100 [Ceratodon purpureus]